MPKQPEVTLVQEGTSSLENDSNSVTSIDRAATILICLSEGANSITELSNNSNLGKSTVHRILNTLAKSRFVTYDSVNHRYYLGPLVTRLSANLQTAHQYLLMRAMTEMKHLSDVTKETISLSLLIGTDISVLYSIPGKYGLKVLEIEGEAGERGSVIPFGSSAKVLLSQLNNKTLQRTLDVIRISNPDFDELVDVDQLYVKLKQIRKDGYSLSRGERILGALSVSAPVKNYTCPVSLNVLGPEIRVSPNIQQLYKELTGSATRLSADILEKF